MLPIIICDLPEGLMSPVMFPAVCTDQGEGREGPHPAGPGQGRHGEGGGRRHGRPRGPGAPRPRPGDDHCLELRPTGGTLSAGDHFLQIDKLYIFLCVNILVRLLRNKNIVAAVKCLPALMS